MARLPRDVDRETAREAVEDLGGEGVASFEPLTDSGVPNAAPTTLAKLAELQVLSVSQWALIATLRLCLRQAFALLERRVDAGTLLSMRWYRDGRVALGGDHESDDEESA